MAVNKDVMLEIVKGGHHEAYGKIKKDISKDDVINILRTIFNCLDHKISIEEAYDTLGYEYGDVLKQYVDVSVTYDIAQILSHVDFKSINRLGNEKFVGEMKAVVQLISDAVMKFYQGDIDIIEFIQIICDARVKMVAEKILEACEVDISQVKNIDVSVVVSKVSTMNLNLDVLGKIAMSMISVVAFTAAFSILTVALKANDLAYERRIEIERQCNESIALIKDYRKNIEIMVEKYLSEHMEVFNNSFRLMDKAIIDNDINGYIKANNDIQEILNYDIQFRNEDEFNDLMDSDDAFKL